jgi:hypothetical protein
MTAEANEQQPFFVMRHQEYLQAAENCVACHEAGHVERIRNMRYLSVRQDRSQD